MYEPTRMCVVCRKKTYKKYLLRYTTLNNTIQENNLVLDIKKNKEGRGYYLCYECSNQGKLPKNKHKKPKSRKV